MDVEFEGGGGMASNEQIAWDRWSRYNARGEISKALVVGLTFLGVSASVAGALVLEKPLAIVGAGIIAFSGVTIHAAVEKVIRLAHNTMWLAPYRTIHELPPTETRIDDWG